MVLDHHIESLTASSSTAPHNFVVTAAAPQKHMSFSRALGTVFAELHQNVLRHVNTNFVGKQPVPQVNENHPVEEKIQKSY